jgi:hypothetical protein
LLPVLGHLLMDCSPLAALLDAASGDKANTCSSVANTRDKDIPC